MKVSDWTKFGKTVWYHDAQLSSAEVVVDEDDKPYACEVTVTRRSGQTDEIVGLVIRLDAEEMFKIFMGIDGWEHKQRVYGEKMMRRSRKEYFDSLSSNLKD